MVDDVGDPSGPGSQAAPEAASASSPSVSIPIAYPYETIVFRFDNRRTRAAFMKKFFPGNPFNSAPMPGVTVTAMAMFDAISNADAYEEALDVIAGGDGEAWEIAQQTLDAVSERVTAEINAQGIEAEGARRDSGSTAQPREPDPVGDAPESTAPGQSAAHRGG